MLSDQHDADVATVTRSQLARAINAPVNIFAASALHSFNATTKAPTATVPGLPFKGLSETTPPIVALHSLSLQSSTTGNYSGSDEVLIRWQNTLPSFSDAASLPVVNVSDFVLFNNHGNSWVRRFTRMWLTGVWSRTSTSDAVSRLDLQRRWHFEDEEDCSTMQVLQQEIATCRLS